jgi:sulfoxide reductase heme-binding subunit YedZ
MTWLKKNGLLLFAHIGSLLPLAILVWDWSQGNLTVNPIQAATLRTGRFAIILLILSLAITPIHSLFGFRWIIPLRKWFGLYSAIYVGIHFWLFIGVDYGYNLSLIKADLFTKRYVIVGFFAGLILLPLALTSTKGWQRRLRKNWKRLHRLIYIAGILASIHFIWLVKSDIRVPLLYGAIVVLLLALRIPVVRRYTKGLRFLRQGLPKRTPHSSSSAKSYPS